MFEGREEGEEVTSQSKSRCKDRSKNYVNPSTRCFCGAATMVRTSWTDLNPGRRFLTCENSKAGSSCGFFSWVDPPMCERSKIIIPGLLRKIRRMEEEHGNVQKKMKTLWVALLLSCSVLLVLWLRDT